LKLFGLTLIFVGLFIAPCPVFGSASSANLPLDSPVYSDLDKLSGLGLIDSSLQGMRPYTRLEAARQVAEARGHATAGDATAVVRQILRRLETELHDQLVELHVLVGEAPDTYFKPLRSVEISYLHQDGEASAIPRTNAHQIALNYNNFGIDYDNHNNGQLTLSSEARIARFFLLDIRPTLEIRDQEGTNLQLLEGRAALQLGSFEVSVGRQSLWWGQGRHGSLVLTNNAEPLDMLRFTNPAPVLLPWVFEYLGPFRFDLFWSRLESDRVVPKPYFAGLRFNFKPLPWFEIGASRTIMFGGKGRPKIGWDEFLTILGGKNLRGGVDTSNSVAALDARLRLPCLWGTEIYGEYGGEDEAGHFLANDAWLAGVFLPKVEPTGRASLRLEYADLSRIDNNSPVWYRHGIYRSGYTYQGKIMGHHAGGAAKDIYSELRIYLPRDLTLCLNFDSEKRGYDQPVLEEHLEPGLGLIWQMNQNTRVEFIYRFDQVNNYNYRDGNDQDFHVSRVGLTFNW